MRDRQITGDDPRDRLTRLEPVDLGVRVMQDLVDTRERAIEHGAVETFLRTEEIAGRPPRDTGRVADELEARRLVAALREESFGRVEDRLPAPLSVSAPFHDRHPHAMH